MTGSTLPNSTSTTLPSPDYEETAQRSLFGDTWARPYSDTATHTAHNAGNRFMDDRAEPSWTEPAPEMSSPPAPEPQHLSAPESTPAAGRRGLRILLMAGIFVIGAGAGLTGAWWASNPPQLPIVSAVKKVPVNSGANANKPVAQARQGGSVRGISPSELPYDGAAPPADVAENVAPSTRAANGAKPAVQAIGKSSETVDTLSSGDSGQDAEKSADQAIAHETGTEKASPASGQPKSAMKAASRSGRGDKVSVASKREATAKSAKDHEIERIRQQADEELRRKPSTGRNSGRSPRDTAEIAKRQSRRESQNASKTASNANMRAMLARCERASNFITREQCKWRLCNGAWGKNGCPYYPTHASSGY